MEERYGRGRIRFQAGPAAAPASAVPRRLTSRLTSRLTMLGVAAAAAVGAVHACGAPVSQPAAAAQSLATGSWGGENAGVIVDDTVAHVHVGCTFGNFPAPVRLDGAGRFSVTGSYVLRAFPVYVGPSHPARFTGTVAGDALTLRVIVSDTVARTTVELEPVTVTLGREARMGPCPICRVPRPLPAP